MFSSYVTYFPTFLYHTLKYQKVDIFIDSWSLCLYFSFIVVTISWSNFLETIPTFKKEYKVSAVMKFNSLTGGNVFRFTLGNDWYQTGDLHPAVWITSSGVWKLSNWNCQAWVLSSKSMSIQIPKKVSNSNTK